MHTHTKLTYGFHSVYAFSSIHSVFWTKLNTIWIVIMREEEKYVTATPFPFLWCAHACVLCHCYENLLGGTSLHFKTTVLHIHTHMHTRTPPSPYMRFCFCLLSHTRLTHFTIISAWFTDTNVKCNLAENIASSIVSTIYRDRVHHISNSNLNRNLNLLNNISIKDDTTTKILFNNIWDQKQGRRLRKKIANIKYYVHYI